MRKQERKISIAFYQGDNHNNLFGDFRSYGIKLILEKNGPIFSSFNVVTDDRKQFQFPEMVFNNFGIQLMGRH